MKTINLTLYTTTVILMIITREAKQVHTLDLMVEIVTFLG